MDAGEELTVSFDVTNTGNRAGDEIVQLYVHVHSRLERPIKELKGFDKILLEPDETKKITINIDIKDIGYYNVILKDWVTEPGEYVIHIGASSRDIRLSQSIFIEDEVPYTINKVGESMIG